jgi:DNA replication protein DnaC
MKQLCHRCTYLHFALVPERIIFDVPNFDPSFNKAEEWCRIAVDNAINGKCIIIGGENGLGKTTLAAVCLYNIIRTHKRELSRGSNCRFVSMIDFGNTYVSAGYNRLSELSEILDGKRLFVFDDVGREPDKLDLFELLIDHCDRRGYQYIITTNLNNDNLKARYTNAVVSRIIGGSGRGTKWIKLTGKDFRQFGSKQAGKESGK